MLNDLEALAYAVPVLEPDELAVLQQGVAVPSGNAAVIAAGPDSAKPSCTTSTDVSSAASEGGHADFFGAHGAGA